MHFLSVNEAIRVLRSGKKDAQWFDAASFLIDRASPEVKLMLEVGRELEKKERQIERDNTSKTLDIKKWSFIVLGAAGLALVAGYLGWLITSSLGINC